MLQSVRALLVLIPFALARATVAQVTLEWDRELQLPPPERLMLRDADAGSNGGWLITGEGALVMAGPGDQSTWQAQHSVLMRTDAQGNVTGTRVLGAPLYPLAPIAVGPAGNVVLRRESTLEMLDPAGNLLWIAGLSNVVRVREIGFAPNGGVLVAGERYAGSFMSELFVAGWTASGTPTFVRTLPMHRYGSTPQHNFAASLSSISSNGLIAIATKVNSDNAGTVRVYHPDGVLAWSSPGPVGFALLTDIVCTPAGEVVVLGHAGAAAKWDANGNLIWTHFINPGWNADFEHLAVSPDGKIAMVGRSRPAFAEPYWGLVSLFEPDGTALWSHMWSANGGVFDNQFDRVAFRSSGELIAAGSAYLNASSNPAQLQTAPAITCWSRDGALAWQYVGASIHFYWEVCRSIEETAAGSIVCATESWNNIQGGVVPVGRLLSIRPQARAFCFGDGSGTPCPCANDAELGTGTGCIHSFGTGALLGAIGNPSIASDTLVLRGTDMPPTSSVLYFQGTSQQNGGAGVVFGDGKRCAAGTVIRLGSRMNASGASELPSAGSAPIHVTGAVSAGDVRAYQGWYRNSAAFCTASAFNLTNGVEIQWGP